ncbi:hypothetical protein DFQ30_009464 [Apophysomyces sp. BC1015]|nr:hypothetical protein DFQ30_009464 [Apophysomyces sp. BC1015]
MVPRYAVHLVLRAEEYRDALMQAFGLDVQDPLFAGGCRAPRLLDDECYRIGFIHEAQLAGLVRRALVRWVHENTAPMQDAVHVRDHRRNPAHVEVDRVLARVDRDAQVSMGQRPRAELTIEREAINAVAGRQHEHRLRAIYCIAGRDLVRALLQERLFGRVGAVGAA